MCDAPRNYMCELVYNVGLNNEIARTQFTHEPDNQNKDQHSPNVAFSQLYRLVFVQNLTRRSRLGIRFTHFCGKVESAVKIS